ncbi:aldolase catalytic domain-containing protein [Candidatus Pelagibacter sp.]|jgi:4-hydroxy 2-oxovalerate aldolase|nr:aldolase catalytic domain-containing protein [Candidatus Pelagibacter sp.]
MKKNKLKILDCTLRDGGYYNNWNFSIQLINKYLKVMSDIKVDYVEIGFRSLEKKEFRGPCAYTTDQFLDNLKIPKTLKVAVMINGAELIKENSLKKNISLINSLFKKSKFSKVKLVRIASHYSELKKVMPVASKIKSLGYNVAINLMQISDRTENEIKQFCDLAKKYNMDAVYFADSTGSLNRDQTLEIVKNFKKNCKIDLGIHAHDNMDMAMENAMMALNNGISWIDSTVLGMGRGPGNVKTENLVLELEKKFKRKVNYNSLIKLVENDFIPMKNKYGWGSNVYYYLSGLYGIHPSFIQGMLSAKNFSSDEILAVIDNLKTEGGKKFSHDLINTYKQYFIGKGNGKYEPIKNIRNKDVLILGSGPGVKEHKIALESFIKKYKPFVIALNTQNSINSKLINTRAVCNTLRLLTDHKSFKYLPQKLILPYQRLSDLIKDKFKKVKKLDFGVEVKNNTFQFMKSSAIIPNTLAISYALGVANSGKAKKIYIAGFDGYEAEDPKRREMDELFSLYQSLKKKSELTSITPTKYKVKSTSVYAL